MLLLRKPTSLECRMSFNLVKFSAVWKTHRSLSLLLLLLLLLPFFFSLRSKSIHCRIRVPLKLTRFRLRILNFIICLCKPRNSEIFITFLCVFCIVKIAKHFVVYLWTKLVRSFSDVIYYGSKMAVYYTVLSVTQRCILIIGYGGFNTWNGNVVFLDRWLFCS